MAATCQERAVLQASVAALRGDRDLNTPTSNLTAIGLQRRRQSEHPVAIAPDGTGHRRDRFAGREAPTRLVNSTEICRDPAMQTLFMFAAYAAGYADIRLGAEDHSL